MNAFGVFWNLRDGEVWWGRICYASEEDLLISKVYDNEEDSWDAFETLNTPVVTATRN